MLDRVSRSYIKNTYIYVCIYTVHVPLSCELVGFEPHLTIYRYITQKPDKYCSEVNKPKLSNGGPTIHVDIYIYTPRPFKYPKKWKQYKNKWAKTPSFLEGLGTGISCADIAMENHIFF